MRHLSISRFVVIALVLLALGAGRPCAAQDPSSVPPGEAWAKALQTVKGQLRERHGASESERIERGVTQTLRLWRAEDGDAAAWQEFVLREFLPQGPTLDRTSERLERAFEKLDGYMVSLSREWKWGVDVADSEQLAIDDRLYAWDPSSHLAEDMFASKIAFVVLLNFPISTLEQKTSAEPNWSRADWARARMVDRFALRVPAQVAQNVARAFTAAETYINGYYLRLDRVTQDGKRVFPEGKRLITHWNLRDEIKALYGERDQASARSRQRAIQHVMEQIVRQSIPAAVIDNAALEWELQRPTPAEAREPDTRYQRWLDVFRAVRGADPYDLDYPSFVKRRFHRDREIPEARIEQLLLDVLKAPLAADVARLISKRLKRPLEPFDIWYAGFKPSAAYSEAELDRLTKVRYPTATAVDADLPRMLRALGFSNEKAQFLSDRIAVDPSRGAGHALGMGRRDDLARLRTHIKPDGMDYKGYNIAVHELGHNVEQTFSIAAIDHSALAGVPNNAFTEAMAMLFQARDIELLGLKVDDRVARRERTLEEFWATREISAVALVDIRAWNWLYRHPEANAAEFRQAVVEIAQSLWNEHFAPHLGGAKDVSLLAIYSHLVQYGLYTPDYAVGHLIAFQLDEHFALKPDQFAAEFERMAKLGRLTPDLWMQQAVGSPLSAEPLLRRTKEALAGP